MTEAVIFSIAANDVGDVRAAAGMLQRIFPHALELPLLAGRDLRIAIPLDDIRQEAPDNGIEDTDAAVLSFLLYTAPVTPRGEQYADILHRIDRGEGGRADELLLRDAGMAYFAKGEGENVRAFLAVIQRHPAIKAAFANTPWRANPDARIARIKRAEQGVIRIILGASHRAILIPMEVVAELAPEAPY